MPAPRIGGRAQQLERVADRGAFVDLLVRDADVERFFQMHGEGDEIEWWHEVGRLVAAHDGPSGLLLAVRELATEQVSLDDVTAVAVYRRSEGDR